MKLETVVATDTGIARAFSDIQEVERVYVSHDGDLDVTTIIDEMTTRPPMTASTIAKEH